MFSFFSDFIAAFTLQNLFNVGLLILCLYPINGAFLWLIGALSYQFLTVDKRDTAWQPLARQQQPKITIMIPAHNEEVLIGETVTALFRDLNYQNYEVLVMNDGSTDHTLAILERLQSRYPRLRVITIDKNQGKAHAFNVGMHFARGDYILSNDADTIPEPDALMKYMNYFMHDTDLNTAAVTANMDVRNRTRLIAKSQTVEFSSIIGVIRRSQIAIDDALYAYSGANTMYKKQFLFDVGGFRQNRATEDISITWDQQALGGVSRFATDIVFHMAVPETFGDLYRQRKRWAQGGTEVCLTNFNRFLRHPLRNRYHLPLFLDAVISIIWSFFFVISSFLFIGVLGVDLWQGQTNQISYTLMVACVFITFQLLAGCIQLLAALLIDHHGAKLKYFLFAPLYILFYWIVNPITVVTSIVPAIRNLMGFGSGTWVSPKRHAQS